MKMALLGIVLIGVVAWAEPPKKGRVMCEGAACLSHEVPTGSVLERPDDALSERAKRRIELERKPEVKAPQKKAANRPRKDRIRMSRSAPERAVVTNLPVYHQGVDRSESEANEKAVFVPRSGSQRIKGLASGDVVWAVVEQEIVASPGVPTPVRAMAVGGPFKGALFLGEAMLDRELKRVCVTFTKLRLKDCDTVYGVKAAALSPSGSVCLEGEYVSQTGRFFVAELASAAAAGFLDSTVSRNQTALGTYVQEPSLANSGRTAAVSALSKTTERMAEEARTAPEYTRVRGYQEIQVMIQDDPVEAGS